MDYSSTLWLNGFKNYGKFRFLDYCYPLSNINLSNGNDMYNSTNWINLRPMYVKGNINS